MDIWTSLCEDSFYFELKFVQFFSFEWTTAANSPYSYGNICKVKWLLRPNIFPHLDSSFLNLIKSFIVLFICCTITIVKVQSRIFAKCMTFCYLNFILLTGWTSEARHMVTLMTQGRIRHIISWTFNLSSDLEPYLQKRDSSVLLFFEGKEAVYVIICPIVGLNWTMVSLSRMSHVRCETSPCLMGCVSLLCYHLFCPWYLVSMRHPATCSAVKWLRHVPLQLKAE